MGLAVPGFPGFSINYFGQGHYAYSTMRFGWLLACTVGTFFVEAPLATCAEAPKETTVCALVANIDSYHRQPVRILGVMRAGSEQTVLFEPSCEEETNPVAVTFAPGTRGKTRRLRQNLRKYREARVLVQGVAYGPEPVSIDPDLPDWLKKGLSGSTRRYGHLNSFEMMIEVSAVLRVEESASQ